MTGPDLSFDSSCRLHTAAEFAAVFAHRRVLRGEFFNLHYLPTGAGGDGTVPSPRLGLVIAKKLARRAVLRNLLKRIGRESFRHAQIGLPPCDIVLRLAKPAAKPTAHDQRSRQVWRAEVDSLLQRLSQRLATVANGQVTGRTQ